MTKMTWRMAMSLVACLPNGANDSRQIQVQVLDALSGKPQNAVTVRYFCTRPLHNSEAREVRTNQDGLAVLEDTCAGRDEIEISVSAPNNKEQCGVGPVNLDQIVAEGFIAKPNADGGIWCPDKISKKLRPIPGRAVLFVKKPTWWQSHVAG